MRSPLLIPIYLIAVHFLSACDAARSPQNAVPKSIISEHVRAFNSGDVEAMGKMQHPDIEWLSVSGSNISIEVAGRDALAKNMTEYFQSPSKVTGTLRDWSINAPYVSVTETAAWVAKDGTEKSQSSLTVYQMEDNLIRRVWYYPSVNN